MFGSYSLIDMFSGSRFGSSHSADRRHYSSSTQFRLIQIKAPEPIP